LTFSVPVEKRSCGFQPGFVRHGSWFVFRIPEATPDFFMVLKERRFIVYGGEPKAQKME